jgi:hypothetical protein
MIVVADIAIIFRNDTQIIIICLVSNNIFEN